MATRLQGTSAGDKGTLFSIEIEDTEYGGSAVDIDFDGRGFELTYTPNRQEPNAEILSSSCKMTIVSTETTSTAINSFINDLTTADEERFIIYIKKSDDSLFWMGYIVTDQIAWQDQDWADDYFKFGINAVDGIGRLKAVEYDDSTLLTINNYRVLAKEHLFNCINHIGLTGVYGATDVCLYMINRWYEDSMTLSLPVNSFDRTFIDHSTFIQKNDSGNDTYLSAYDVLVQLCFLFQSRFLYSDGAYHLQQINQFRETGDLYIHKYYKDGNKPGTDTNGDLRIIEDSDDGIRLAQGRYSNFAPVKRIEVTWENLRDQNYIQGKTWSENSDTSIQTPLIYDYSGLRLLFKGTLRHQCTFTGITPARMVFRLEITANVDNITTYYLKRTYNTGFGGVITYNATEWTTDPADVYNVVASANGMSNQNGYTNIFVDTPDLPGSGEFVIVTVDWEYVTTLFQSVSGVDWEMYNSSLQLNSDDTEALTSEEVYTLENANSPNASTVLGYETLLSDPGLVFTSRSLTIQNDGGDEVHSDGWFKGLSGTTYSIIELYMQELIKIRRAPLKKFEGQIYTSDYFAHHIYQFSTDNSKWSLLRGTYNAARETWKGLWFYNAYGDPVPEENVIIKIPPTIDPPIGPPSLPEFPSETPGNVDDEVFSDSPGETIAITDDVLSTGTITSLPIYPTGADNVIISGDEVVLYDPNTGSSQTFTVSSDVGGTDTSISVNSQATTTDFSEESYVIIREEAYINNVQNEVYNNVQRFVQVFVSTGSSTLTVTANGGTLPSVDYIDVIDGGFELTHGASYDYTVSGSNIILSYAPRVDSIIKVKFWIIG
jgi:hypothetical protein